MPKKPKREFNEYIRERPGLIPELNYDHHHLWGFSAEAIEGLALQNAPVRIKVENIVGIGNNRANHYDHNWNPLPMEKVSPELQEKHQQILEKLKFHQDRINSMGANAKITRSALNTVFEGDAERAIQLPGGDFVVVGGADRMHFAKRYELDTINAHVVKLEDLVTQLQLMKKVREKKKEE